nr:hypothetical protein [Candidatus Freyarchaeota archaeon]
MAEIHVKVCEKTQERLKKVKGFLLLNTQKKKVSFDEVISFLLDEFEKTTNLNNVSVVSFQELMENDSAAAHLKDAIKQNGGGSG